MSNGKLRLVDRFLLHSRWALEFMVASRTPVTVLFFAALISAVVAGYKQRPFGTRRWKRYYWLALTHLLFFPAAIAVGVIWQNTVANPTIAHHVSPVANAFEYCLEFGSVASFIFWVWRMKTVRWFATSVMLLMQMPIFAALFVAGMSVSGEWL